MEPLIFLLIISGITLIWGFLGSIIEDIFGLVPNNKIVVMIYGPVGLLSVVINYLFFGD